MYTRDDKEEHTKKLVESALESYQHGDTAGAGYNILRYAQRGLIAVDASVDPNVFVDWYPLHQGYVLLRLAKQGKLLYKRKE